MYIYTIEAGSAVGAAPQKYVSCLLVAAPQKQ